MRSEKLAVVMKRAAAEAPDKKEGKLTDYDTLRAYSRNIDKFCDWLQEKYGVKREQQLDRICNERDLRRQDIIQQYADEMVDAGRLKATSLHTYLAPVCKGLSVKMKDIDKPIRKSADIVKNTIRSTNERGQKEQLQERLQPMLELASIVPVRPQALVRLTTDCITRTPQGDPVVSVRDKGGKISLQILLPGEEARVRELLSKDLSGRPVAPGERPFSKKDLGHIAWSQFRAKRSQELERHFERVFAQDPAARLPWIDRICELYKESHPSFSAAKIRKYREDLERPGRYALRGGNLARAKELGRPTSYDRVALRIASVYGLSHWVDETTVRNYLTK